MTEYQLFCSFNYQKQRMFSVKGFLQFWVELVLSYLVHFTKYIIKFFKSKMYFVSHLYL